MTVYMLIHYCDPIGYYSTEGKAYKAMIAYGMTWLGAHQDNDLANGLGVYPITVE